MECSLEFMKSIEQESDCFTVEICERKTRSKTFSKYIAAFDYCHKILLVLSATGGDVSYATFATVIGRPVGITSASITLVFAISNEIAKKLLKTMRKKKKKQQNCFTSKE